MDIAVVGCGVSLALDASGACTAARVALAVVRVDRAVADRVVRARLLRSIRMN